jgi:MFS family permease
MTEAPVDPRTVMRERAMNLQQYGVVALCVLINMIDGYDILALAQAGSALKREWGLSDAELGTLLSMNLVGMALGALGVSPVADQFGRRPAILTCLCFMSLGMAMAAISDGFLAMAIARVVTGIGIGGMTATAGMLALEYASQRRREFAASAVASAYPVGTIIGGLRCRGGARFLRLARDLLGRGEPVRSPAAGRLPVAAGIARFPADPTAAARARDHQSHSAPGQCPRDHDTAAQAEGTGPSVAQEILTWHHIRELLKLFLAHALNMFAWYFIINWGPPLVAEAGASDELGALYSSWLSYGGIVGGLSAGFLCGTVGVRRMMWFTMLSLAVLITLFGVFVDDPDVLIVLAPLMGAALFGSATANWLTIAYAFPPQLRATGLGLGTTAGRIGSVFGPIVGGALLNTRSTGEFALYGVSFPLTLTVAGVCLIMAIPAVLSALTFSQARRLEPGR